MNNCLKQKQQKQLIKSYKNNQTNKYANENNNKQTTPKTGKSS